MPNGPRRLQTAIEVYEINHLSKLDDRGQQVLVRLRESSDAASAFERLKLKNGEDESDLLTIFIQADMLSRNFSRLLKDAQSKRKDAETAVAALTKISSFLKSSPAKVPMPSADVGELQTHAPPADEVALTRAVELISRFIEWRKGVCEAAIAQLGTSRKSSNNEASEAAAIWWFVARSPEHS